jgi:hypothetical protein
VLYSGRTVLHKFRQLVISTGCLSFNYRTPAKLSDKKKNSAPDILKSDIWASFVRKYREFRRAKTDCPEILKSTVYFTAALGNGHDKKMTTDHPMTYAAFSKQTYEINSSVRFLLSCKFRISCASMAQLQKQMQDIDCRIDVSIPVRPSATVGLTTFHSELVRLPHRFMAT